MAKVEVRMPKMGESITEGTVVVWHKQPGDAIALDESLLEIGTDKVDTDVPSPGGGILAEILVQEGETVDVGTLIAVIETESAGPASNGTEASSEGAVPAAEAAAPETAAPETAAPETAAPETAAPETAAPETAAPETAVPETAAPETAAPETAVPESASTENTSSSEEDEAPETVGQAEVAVVAASPEKGNVHVIMPKMGESITEGTILTWFKSPGDEIALDESILEIATDKVDTEIPAPMAGVLTEILVPEGETVAVGTPIAVIAIKGDSASSSGAQSSAPAVPPATASPSPTQTVQSSNPVLQDAVLEFDRTSEAGKFYSPLVRSIAAEERLTAEELDSIAGSGRGGRVSKSDVLAYLKNRSRIRPIEIDPAVQPEPTSAPATPPAKPILATDAPVPKKAPGDRVEVVKMDRMRQLIAEHMTRSKSTSAHVTSFGEADVTNLVRLREKNKDAFFEREGVKLTYTPFFVFAAVEALRDHPMLNSAIVGDEIHIQKDYHIGIAVALGKTGLVVPVIHNAGQKNLVGLAHAAADLAERTRKKQLLPDELQGGTFTVTNVGSLGSIMGTPIINQPQVGILATGVIKKRPVVIEGGIMGDTIGIRHMMFISLSYDHRIVDGAMGSSFLQKYVDVLEGFNPHEVIN